MSAGSRGINLVAVAKGNNLAEICQHLFRSQEAHYVGVGSRQKMMHTATEVRNVRQAIL